MKHLFLFLLFILFILSELRAQEGDSEAMVQIIDTSEYVQGDIDFNLLVAAYKGYDTEVLRLLNADAGINSTTFEGITPLMYAAGGGHLNVVKILLVNGADVQKRPTDGRTALIAACQGGYTKIAEELLLAGAIVDETDQYGATSLHYASAYNHYLTCDMLLYYRADPNRADYTQTTPLMTATYAGNIGVAEMLIDQGARVNSRDENGYSAIMIAAQKGDTAFVRFLKDHGGDIGMTSDDGLSAFHMALYNGYTDAVNMLWESGIKDRFDPSSRPDPYTLARIGRSKEAKKWLKEHGFQKNFSPLLRNIYLGINLDWNNTDYYLGFKTGVEELIYGVNIELGFKFRPTKKRILIQEDGPVYYQFWEKRNMISASIGKQIRLFTSISDYPFGLYMGLGGTCSFGPQYRGSTLKAGSIFRIVPAAGFYIDFKNSSFRMTYEYLSLKIHKVEPHWINFDIFFKIPLSKKRFSNKTIPWY